MIRVYERKKSGLDWSSSVAVCRQHHKTTKKKLTSVHASPSTDGLSSFRYLSTQLGSQGRQRCPLDSFACDAAPNRCWMEEEVGGDVLRRR